MAALSYAAHMAAGAFLVWQAKARLTLEEELRASMDWLKQLRSDSGDGKSDFIRQLTESATGQHTVPCPRRAPPLRCDTDAVHRVRHRSAASSGADTLALTMRHSKPPPELLSALGVWSINRCVVYK